MASLAYGRVGIAYGLLQLGPGTFDVARWFPVSADGADDVVRMRPFCPMDLFLGKHQKLVGLYRG